MRNLENPFQRGKDKIRNDGINEIAGKQLSINEITKEENKLEEKIALWETERLFEFSRTYPTRELASHENDIVRKITTEAIQERHQLSNIYSRDHQTEREEDKLYSLIPTALTVWKNGILDIRLNDLFSEFRKIAGKGMAEEELKLQSDIAELIRLRSQVAKNIGDRIIDPGVASMKRRPGKP